MYKSQNTLSKIVDFTGIGLHSGEKVKISLIPTATDTGINFKINNTLILASWQNAVVSQLCTRLKFGENAISTIEHLMAAISGLGITNLIIKINSNEVPILDGSSKEFVDEIRNAGIIEQKKKQKILKILRKVEHKDQEKFIRISPSKKKNLSIDYTIDYKDQFIKKQNLKYTHSEKNFLKIYKSRTFCLHNDLERIFSMGLAKGGSLDNAIVVSGNKILNQGGLRYNNEFVRHKTLDCIGDLYLAGYQIWGDLVTYQGGHELNLRLLREILADKKNYKIVDQNT
ncbi:MAG: UDP-3-O-[3-hydroxymyristoyl] N-acetylglucosamine deacetylase [alpha proteobacterium HIMB114]|nr:MAG: UDP-3-O-[3-hydroxymyristoyl] N-acetylglucosamine deacetylase [alpha proteobacterium HIMB114]